MPRFNTTQLYIDRATERGIVHRDYLAHCLRWTHILKHAKVGQRILDVGCGVNTPLAWTMYTNKFKPGIYVGLDFRKSFDTDPTAFNFPVELRGGFDVTSEKAWDDLYLNYVDNWDIVTCLEVIEHMEREDGVKLLENLSHALGRNTLLFLSTPCFNGSAAANHVYEWKYAELRDELRNYFKMEAVYGTFASQSELLPFTTLEERAVFNSLKEYYDTNLLAVLLAPLHPDRSRNAIWRLRALR